MTRDTEIMEVIRAKMADPENGFFHFTTMFPDYIWKTNVRALVGGFRVHGKEYHQALFDETKALGFPYVVSIENVSPIMLYRFFEQVPNTKKRWFMLQNFVKYACFEDASDATLFQMYV